MTDPLTGQPAVPGLGDLISRFSRQLFATVAAIVLTAATGFAASDGLRNVNIDERRPALEANESLMKAMLAAQTGMRGFIASGQEGFLSYPTPQPATVRAATDKVARLAPEVARGQVARQRAAVEEWLAFRDRVNLAKRQGKDAGAMLSSTPFPRFTATNDELESVLEGEVAHYSNLVTLAMLATAGLVLAELAVLVWLLLRLRSRLEREVVHPLEELRDTITQGDSGRRAPTDVGPGEIRALGVVVNQHVDVAERDAAERLVEERVARGKDRLAMEIRKAFSERGVLLALRDGLREALVASAVVVLRHEADHPVWQAAEDHGTVDGRIAIVDGRHPVTPALREAAHVIGDPAWMATLVRPHDGPAAVVVVTSRSERTWAPVERHLLAQGCDFASRGIDQSAFDEQRAATISRLEALDKQKTDFMATVSHELRTPLTSIAGYLELIEDGDFGDVPPEQAAVLGVIGRNTARLRALIEDLLVLSRIEASGVDVDPTPVALGTLVQHVAENLRPQALAGEVQLVVEPLAEAFGMQGDAGQLERALTNIIGNAVKFTPPGGTVTVDVRRDRELVEVRVADTGIGIPEKDLQDIGRRFFRASNVTTQSIPGTGLGLSIVRAIAEAHHGDLLVRSTPGHGTTVTLRVGSVLVRP